MKNENSFMFTEYFREEFLLSSGNLCQGLKQPVLGNIMLLICPVKRVFLGQMNLMKVPTRESQCTLTN